MGYATRHAKAIIAIAKASKSCAGARKLWSMEVAGVPGYMMGQLLRNVRHLGAVYAVHFQDLVLLDETPLARWLREKGTSAGQPELTEEDIKQLLGILTAKTISP